MNISIESEISIEDFIDSVAEQEKIDELIEYLQYYEEYTCNEHLEKSLTKAGLSEAVDISFEAFPYNVQELITKLNEEITKRGE